MNKTLCILAFSAILFGQALSQTLDPSQAHYVKKYQKQPNPPKPEEMLLNTDKEPDLTEGFTNLFNGDNTDGWTPWGGNCTFEALAGSIVGTVAKGSPSTYLCTDKEYSDFIFSCEMKWLINTNSGVMIRAKIRKDKKGGDEVFGPQAEMEGFTERGWSGGIYGQSCGGWWYPLWLEEHADARKALKEGEWNRLTIQAKGKTVKTWINGVPAAHWTHEEYLKGRLGLQVHSGNKGQVMWREIKVKELK